MTFRKLPEPLLASPVLVTLETGSNGSGFLLDLDGVMFLLTAKHVLFNDSNKLRAKRSRLICQTRIADDSETKEFATEFNDKNVFSSDKYDIAAIEIGRLQNGKLHCTKGTRVEIENKLNTTGMYLKNTTQLEDVFIGNDVYVFGYHTSIGLKRLLQFDYTKPLVRKGIVSGIYLQKGNIIIDCPVFNGNSGGPVIIGHLIGNGDIEYKIIGIVSQQIPYKEKWINPVNKITNIHYYNSGYSVVIGVNLIFEMLRENGFHIE